ncbi:MAG: YggT family protein [Robiginitomaculum sp.]
MSTAIFNLLMNIIGLYLFIILIWIISSWLITFGIINPRNPTVRNILNGINALVDPVIAPLRRIIPPMGGLDLSPIVLIFGIYFIRDILVKFHQTGSIF